jgi:RNA polymerase sigma factor (sigma-70 family)
VVVIGSVLVTLTDADLLELVRQGDETAFTELYSRHREVASRMAATYCRSGEADDLVDLAFEKVLGALRRGRGPTEAFRAYLFVTLRRLAAEQAARPQEWPFGDVPEPLAAVSSLSNIDPVERQMVTHAFESLPGRWQAILWHTAVEGRNPRELSSLLGMSANAVAALAYRAREKLRQAYLQAHLQAAPRPQCEPHRSRLGAYVREGLSRRDKGATEGHVEKCASCRSLVAELLAVNELLVRSLHPVFIASAAAEAGAAAAAGGATVGAGGAAMLARRLGSKARSNPAVVAGAVLVAALAFALIASHGGETPPPEVATPEEEPPRIQQLEDPPATTPTTPPPTTTPDPPRPTTTRPATTTTTTAAAQPAVEPAPAPAPAPAVTPAPEPTVPGTTTTTLGTPPPPPRDDGTPLLILYLRGLLGIRVNLTGDRPLAEINAGGAAQESAPEDCGMVAILVLTDHC